MAFEISPNNHVSHQYIIVGLLVHKPRGCRRAAALRALKYMELHRDSAIVTAVHPDSQGEIEFLHATEGGPRRRRYPAEALEKVSRTS